jgi:starch-binding outer membrane protein, SusD/RagB family
MKWKENIFRSLVVTGILCAGLSCTKTVVPVYDQVSNFYRTPDEINAAIGSVYAGLRNLGPGFSAVYDLNEMSTDEIIVPNRITNWQDDDTWEQMWDQTWDATHPFIETAWQNIFSAISNINSVMFSIDSIRPSPAGIAYMNAELRTIRAFYYYEAIDLFGDVPLYESNNVPMSSLSRQPRSVVFAYIENELKNSLPDLTSELSEATYGYATKWLAFSILAKLYLNAEVFTGNNRWADCVSVCDSILLSNNFGLEGNFFDNFQIENQNSIETVFAIPFDVEGGLGGIFIQGATLHYNSYLSFGLESFGLLNGFCSVQAYLDNFNPNDSRKKMFLTGQQYIGETQYVTPAPDSTKMVYDDSGNPLIFDPDITSFIVQEPETEGAGARCAKWEFNKQTPGSMSNDYQLFRLADIILMKTEAQFNLGDNGGALNTINQKISGVSIRSRANMPDFAMAELTPDGILAERARELSWEGWRRNDMIRLGHFTDARIPEKIKTGDFRKLFPIPQVELRKNTYLSQNTGY